MGLSPDAVEAQGRTGGVSDGERLAGTKMYYFLMFCPMNLYEAARIVDFYDVLLANQSARTVIQATQNSLVSNTIENAANRIHLTQFYHILDTYLEFTHGFSLLATDTSSAMEQAIKSNSVFTRKFSDKMSNCKNNTCSFFTDFGKSLSMFLSVTIPLFRQGQNCIQDVYEPRASGERRR
jgi:hypothetical protein